MSELYVGLMSGTSMDAVDAALVDFTNSPVKLLATHSTPLPTVIKNNLSALCTPGENEINRMGELDVQLGEIFAETVLQLLQQNKITSKQIRAIGSHGQTIRHHPQNQHPFTYQIGDPNVIAEKTGMLTVADFRRRDVALGGQGAPLAPAFHNFVFRNSGEDRIVLNIGGIANITWLPADPHRDVLGFDTGPGNTLLDAWISKNQQKAYDEKGQWAESGNIHYDLLENLLSDSYFKLKPPKSTGREHFNLKGLAKYLSNWSIPAQDTQATLCELTALSISDAIKTTSPKAKTILVCGGGIKNDFLIQRLKANCPDQEVCSTEKFGIPPAWVEAMTFAWLAQQTLAGKPGNLPSVTGARKEVILGGIYQ